jgi:hypothetical protein
MLVGCGGRNGFATKRHRTTVPFTLGRFLFVEFHVVTVTNARAP